MARSPQAASPQRIEPLATLPLFFKLKGRRVLLAGASDGALWKAELIAAAGADVHVYAEGFSEEFAALAARFNSEAASPSSFASLSSLNTPSLSSPRGGGKEDGTQENPLPLGQGNPLPLGEGREGGNPISSGTITLHPRLWQAGDMPGAALAIGDIEDEAAAEAFVLAANAAGVPVNVVDKPSFCEFQFGGIVNRSPLIISISTDGAAPVFGQAIRAKIEAIIPRGFKAWAEAARDWRPAVQALALPFAQRRRFWERFTAKALAAASTAPTTQDQADLMAGIGADAPQGRVTLVGAGPGDPELLTLKAMRVLQAADVILHDDLVSPEVLELARREAKRIMVGKTGYAPSCKQQDINAMMVSLAQEGKQVVRLKSGDPMIFGRASEEIEVCEAAGVPVAIIPGITSAQGAAASLGLSLTERKKARRVQFVTGHSQEGALPEDLNWQALADPRATTIIYMPKKTLHRFRDEAIAAGLPADTPALAVMNATRVHEARLFGTITTLPDQLMTMNAAGPVLVLMGAVVAKHATPPPHIGACLFHKQRIASYPD